MNKLLREGLTPTLNKLIILGIIILLSVVIFSLIQRDMKAQEEMVINQDPEKTITHITSGPIEANTLIAVRFKEDQVSEDSLNQIIRRKEIFRFSPSLKGKVYWTDPRTVVFKPKVLFSERRSYAGVIDLTKLFPELENIKPKREVIEFNYPGQQVENFTGEFELVTKDKQQQGIFKAQLKLTEKTSLTKVKDALQLIKGEEDYKLTIDTADGLTFKIRSQLISRTDRDQNFKLIVKKEKLNLAEEIKKEYLLPAVGDLRIIRVEEEKEGDYSKLNLIFSEKLNPDQEYKNYLNLTPEIEFEVKEEGRRLILSGEFKPNQKYNLKVFKGIKSKWGDRLSTTKDFNLQIKISNREPKLEFAQSGVFLTGAKDKTIAFKTMNLSRVTFKLKKVNEDNLINFLADNSLQVTNRSYQEYERYSFQRLGELIATEILTIGEEKNKWIQSELDLAAVVDDKEPGLYILQLEFDGDDVLYFPDDWEEWKYRNYIRRNGRKVKHLIFTDLGITARRTLDKTYVFITDVLTTDPVENAVVKLKTESNKLIETAVTDKQGMCVLKNKGDYLEVKANEQYSILKFKEARLDTSLFDVGGVNTSEGIKAFIYQDRGVYRPGDKVNLSLIARNESKTFPPDHPVTLKVYNPKKKLVHEETIKEAEDGFYSFNFKSGVDALTGDWQAQFSIGNSSFSRVFKVEEIVPYKIRVKLSSAKEELTLQDEEVNFTLSSQYLFGAPAGELESKTSLEVNLEEVKFNRYQNFTFNNPGLDFKQVKSKEFEKKLDKAGKTEINWQLPKIKNPPAALRLDVKSKVLEKGGRQVPAGMTIPIKTYDRYVGIKELEESNLQMGSEIKFNTLLVSDKGQPIAGEKLKYRIYHLQQYWWWEYENRSSFRRHYKKNTDTKLVEEGVVTSREGLAQLEYTPDNYGEFFIEVEDVEGGHSAGYFFRSYWWGDEETGESAQIANLKTDKEKYYPGDTAQIVVKTPGRGRALLTVEKGGKLLHRSWKEITDLNTSFEVPITEELIPNAYVSVALYQPYQDRKNDLPVRMHGVMPIKVENRDSKLEFTVKTPETVKPKEDFTVKIQSKNKKPAQFTVAVVDEGLLNITNFTTPDPWEFFYQQERLLTEGYDTFSDIIGLNWGYVHNVFSIGGGMRGEDYEKKQLQAVRTDRFKPVAMFEGPIKTDAFGQAEVSFKMPNYIGSVRVMVIGAKEESYSSVDKDIRVKAPLMVLPTLPRVLGPEDRIKVPVTVFGMEEKLGRVEVELEVEGPVKIIGTERRILNFTEEENKDIEFELKGKAAIGEAKIKITAETEEYRAEKEVDLAVRPYNPYTYLAEEKVIKPGERAEFKIPEEGIANSNRAQINIAKRKSLNLNRRLKWLVRYPYGCIEQTTSSIFPQLYLKDLFSLTKERAEEIDKNINAGIDRMRKFQLSSGGFSYWPNGSRPNLWGTNYAGHFLLEADKKGYFVPEELLANWLKYQKKQSKAKVGNYLTRAYRLYLLALADEPVLSAMNYMRESELKKLGKPDRCLLAAAYKLAGYEDIGRAIIKELDFEVEDYNEFAGTYGSGLRDKAIMLEVVTLFEDYNQALKLYNELAEELSSNEWYSTQTTAYSLLATGKYLTAEEKLEEKIRGRIITANNQDIEFNTARVMTDIPLTDSFGDQVTVINDSNRPIFVTREWEGIPLRSNLEDLQHNLDLEVEWLDEEGEEINPEEVTQGTTFWGHFKVKKEDRRELIEEVALVQILPAGWEIENTRLSGEDLPEWTKKYNLNNEEYLDIRDDRISWFFDLERHKVSCDFVVKINAVTAGKFYLPPTFVEAMYNNNYKAVTEGKEVKVLKR